MAFLFYTYIKHLYFITFIKQIHFITYINVYLLNVIP